MLNKKNNKFSDEIDNNYNRNSKETISNRIRDEEDEIREMREDVQKKCCKINSSKLMTKDNGKEMAA